MYKGKVWTVGNDVDTDVIIAARYLNDASDENMRKHCLEDAIPNFSEVIAPGDIPVSYTHLEAAEHLRMLVEERS